MKPATEAKLLVAAIGAAAFVIGGALGPSGLSHAFNSAAEFAQFALTGAATVLTAGLGAWGGSKLFVGKGVDGLAAITPGIVGMVFGFAVGAGAGNLAGQELASHIGHHEQAAIVSVAPDQQMKTPAIPSLTPEIF
jgi:hypothetical protein